MFLMSITIRPCKNTHEVWHTYARVKTYTTYILCVHRSLPKQCVFHRSLLVSLWEWFVGKVGELTLRWANNNRIFKNTFCRLHSLSVWFITPSMGSADWRLNNLHRVTWWQLETHSAIRTVHKDDKAMVHPSVVFLTGKDSLLLYCSCKKTESHKPYSSKVLRLTNLFFLIIFKDRFWTASSTSVTGLVERVAQWRETCHKGITQLGHLPLKDWALNSTGTFSSGR